MSEPYLFSLCVCAQQKFSSQWEPLLDQYIPTLALVSRVRTKRLLVSRRDNHRSTALSAPQLPRSINP